MKHMKFEYICVEYSSIWLCPWNSLYMYDVIKWKKFPRYWPFVRGIHRSPVNSPHNGQWRGALMFSLMCAWINGWVNNRENGNLRRHHAHYDVMVMDDEKRISWSSLSCLWVAWSWNVVYVITEFSYAFPPRDISGIIQSGWLSKLKYTVSIDHVNITSEIKWSIWSIIW